METHRLSNVGPLSLTGLAALLALGVALRPNPVIDLGAINLSPGSTMQATFKAGYAEMYEIGVRMDQKTAQRLYPCTVSVEEMQKPECKSKFSSWPIALIIRMSSDKGNISNEITPYKTSAGGQYEGDSVYTYDAASIRLFPGEMYKLSVRSTGQASSLASAHPHLVVSAAGAPGLLEGNAIMEIEALLAGSLLLMSAAIWAVINARRKKAAMSKLPVS